MKNLIISLLSICFIANAAQAANACKAFHDSCVKKGVSRANDGIHQCEWEEANAAKDQPCIKHLQKRYYRRHHKQTTPAPQSTN